MASFQKISQSGPVTARVGEKTTLLNTGTCSVFVTNADIDEALSTLEYGDKVAVLKSLYAVNPGETRKLNAGTYNLEFFFPSGGAAILSVE